MVEAALNYAIKVEAYKQPLVCQGTSVTEHDDSHAKSWSHNAYAVTDQYDSSKTAMLWKRVEEAQEPLEQATKGIAVLTTGPWSGQATQPGAAATVNSVRGTHTRNCASRGTAKARGAARGKFWRENAGTPGRHQDLKTDPCRNCVQLGHWVKGCDQKKKVAAVSAEVKSIICPLVSSTRICVTAEINGNSFVAF